MPGDGLPIVLIHGIGSTSATWDPILDRLVVHGQHVVTFDLPGHGDSSKEPGDYSLGSLASTVRDFLNERGYDRVHLIGHSLGGGIALQFTYQFPERVASLMLVSSGGLGQETALPLRVATLPGSSAAIKLAINRHTMTGAKNVSEFASRLGIRPYFLTPDAINTVEWLADDDHREAFLSLLRSVVNSKGQRVTALDKLSLLNGANVTIVWGDHDPMIPHSHGEVAHELLPGSTLVVFRGADHEPHLYDPDRFTELVMTHITLP